MPQIEYAKQGERIGGADFDASYAEGRTANHLTEVALARRQMLADPRKAQAQLAEKTDKVDELEFEITLGGKLAQLDQLWTAPRDTDDFWLSGISGVVDNALRDANRDIYVELQVRVFMPFTTAEKVEKVENAQQRTALKKAARDAYRDLVNSQRFHKHAKQVSAFLKDAARQKKWTKIIVGLAIAFAAFALGQWEFAAVLADGGGVFAAATAGGVVTTGATIAMEKLILGHDPTIGSISTSLISTSACSSWSESSRRRRATLREHGMMPLRWDRTAASTSSCESRRACTLVISISPRRCSCKFLPSTHERSAR